MVKLTCGNDGYKLVSRTCFCRNLNGLAFLLSITLRKALFAKKDDHSIVNSHSFRVNDPLPLVTKSINIVHWDTS